LREWPLTERMDAGDFMKSVQAAVIRANPLNPRHSAAFLGISVVMTGPADPSLRSG
jgi:hypothetical protein